MKYYLTPAFKEIQREWQRKLKSSGFTDIENDRQQLSGNSKHKKVSEQERFDYFRLITNSIYQEGFIVPPDISSRDLIVMAMRGNGYQIGHIAKENDLDRKTVRFIIRRYEHLWGIRFWTKRQRNQK